MLLKPVKNSLCNWYTDGSGANMRIVGIARRNQPEARVDAGDLLRTSALVRIYRDSNGCLIAETKNSEYYLV